MPVSATSIVDPTTIHEETKEKKIDKSCSKIYY